MQPGTYVYCTTRVIGFHRWPNAPDNVKYLADRHRHEFHIKVTVRVTHDNREVEFITLKGEVDDFFRPLNPRQLYPDFHDQSCEMIAKDLWVHLVSNPYNFRVTDIEVSEDGENGAILVWE